ncbi:hypothetical protein [Paraflavitalea sp. CAU 1676]|uniref:hypothetical protein n=1 Tax=Paraflavitalea sp. CAU 1676 TaxID=3032598 RepID=UPI0023DAD1F5|nr:hypothetical protein [Paraflavitalea sp. CAU 1676]MDF2192618.1 hypothetical protein [Paraflavitalea sp. CAU 1676]
MKHEFRVLRTKHAEWILGVSTRTSQRRMNAVRNFYGKEPRSAVTILEFCQYFKYKVNDIMAILKGRNLR